MNADEAWEEFKKKAQGYNNSETVQKSATAIPDQLNIISAQLNETINRLNQLESKVDEVVQAATPSAESADMGASGIPPELMGGAPQQPAMGGAQEQQDPNALLQALVGQQEPQQQDNIPAQMTKKSIPVRHIRSKSIKKAKKGYAYPGEAWVVGDYVKDPANCKIFRSKESAEKYAATYSGEVKPPVTYAKSEFPEIPLVTYTVPGQTESHRIGINISFTPDPSPEPPREPVRPKMPEGVEANKLNMDIYNAQVERYNEAMKRFEENSRLYELAKAKVEFNNKLRYAEYLNAKKNFNVDPSIADRNISALMTQNKDLEGLYKDFRTARSTGTLSDADTVSMYHLLKDYLVKYNKYSGGAIGFKEAPMTRIMMELARALKRWGADNNPYVNEAIYGTHHLDKFGERTNADSITGEDILSNMDKFKTRLTSLSEGYNDVYDPSNPLMLRGMRFKTEPNMIRSEDERRKKWEYDQDDEEFPFVMDGESYTSFNDFDDDTLKNIIKLTAYIQPEAVKRAFSDAFDTNTLIQIGNNVKQSLQSGDDYLGGTLLEKILTVATPDEFKIDGELSFSDLDIEKWANTVANNRTMPAAMEYIRNEIGDEEFFDGIGDIYVKSIGDSREGVFGSPFTPLKSPLNMQLAKDAFKSTQNLYDALDTVDELTALVNSGKFVTGKGSDTAALSKLWEKFRTLATSDDGGLSIDKLASEARSHTADYESKKGEFDKFLENYRQKAQSETGLDRTDVEALGIDLDDPTFEQLDDIDDDIIRDGVIEFLHKNNINPVNAFELLPLDEKIYGTLGGIKNKLTGKFGERGGVKPVRTNYRTEGRRSSASEPTEYELMFMNNLQNASDDYTRQNPDAEQFIVDGKPNLGAVPGDIASNLHNTFVQSTRNGRRAMSFDPRQYRHNYESIYGKPIPTHYDYVGGKPGSGFEGEELDKEYDDVMRKVLGMDLQTASSENPAIGTKRDTPDMSRDEDFNTMIPSWLTAKAVQAYNRLMSNGDQFADSYEDDVATIAYYMSYRDAIKEVRYGPGTTSDDTAKTNYLVERLANLRMPIYLNKVVGHNDPMKDVKEINGARVLDDFRGVAFPNRSGVDIRAKRDKTVDEAPSIPPTAKFYYGRDNLTPLTKDRRGAVEAMLREGRNESGADLSPLERQALEMMLRFNVDAMPRSKLSYSKEYWDQSIIPQQKRKKRREPNKNPDYSDADPDLVRLHGRPLSEDVYSDISQYVIGEPLTAESIVSGIPIDFDMKKLYDLGQSNRQDYREFINNVTDPSRMHVKDSSGNDTDEISPYYIPIDDNVDAGLRELLGMFRLALNKADYYNGSSAGNTPVTTIGWVGGKPSVVERKSDDKSSDEKAPETESTKTETPESDDGQPADEHKPEKTTPKKASVSYASMSIRGMIKSRGVGNGVFRY